MFLGVVLLCILLVLFLIFKRETKEWTEDITVAPNIEISVDLMSSQRGYFGSHGLGWGGGGQKNEITFVYDGVAYEDDMPFVPIAIRYYQKDFYIIYFDRETDFNKITFRFFKSTKKGGFKEIESDQFPKQIAVQNRWFDDKKQGDKIRRVQLDEVSGSLTAKVWCQLETGEEYYEMPYYIPLEFLESFKKKYIQ